MTALVADRRGTGGERGLLGRGDTLLANSGSQRGAELLEVLEGHRARSVYPDSPEARRR